LKRRYTPKKPKGYDSFFEKELHETVFDGIKHHPDRVTYTQTKTYEPDFVFANQYGFVTYVEAKGRFRDNEEARKYTDVRNALTQGEELIFVFMKPETPMPFAKKRKDGTKYTHAEWADKNGFRWFTKETIKDILCLRST
jgi:hypothetical protein